VFRARSSTSLDSRMERLEGGESSPFNSVTGRPLMEVVVPALVGWNDLVLGW